MHSKNSLPSCRCLPMKIKRIQKLYPAFSRSFIILSPRNSNNGLWFSLIWLQGYVAKLVYGMMGFWILQTTKKSGLTKFQKSLLYATLSLMKQGDLQNQLGLGQVEYMYVVKFTKISSIIRHIITKKTLSPFYNSPRKEYRHLH